MAEIHVSSGITINRITRVGDIGEPGYSVYGEDLPACKDRNAHDWWHGATQGNNVAYAMPSRCYITETVYNYLTPEEREDARSRIIGIVADSYWKTGTCPSYPYTPSPVFSVSTARPLPLSDPCAGVVCEPDCFGTSNLYETVCYEGECKLGPLMEENSPDCPGYVPPAPFVCNDGELRGGTVCPGGNIIYTEICRSNEWVPTGDVCPDKPIPPIPPEPDNKWVTYILIVVAVVLFYLLGWHS